MTEELFVETENEDVVVLGDDAENISDHDDSDDYIWNSFDVVSVVLNGSSITTNGNGLSVNGNDATITSAGTYSFSGTLSDGLIMLAWTCLCQGNYNQAKVLFNKVKLIKPDDKSAAEGLVLLR